MWLRLKNFLSGLRTYSDLSPDLALRRRVNRSLRQRPALSAREWYVTHWLPLGISQEIADFSYTHLTQHSGIDFSRTFPIDQLQGDLHLTLVCWFDWELAFCEEFWHRFQVDITDRFNLADFTTLQELLTFLNEQVVAMNSTSDW
jgi:hypothetical protein